MSAVENNQVANNDDINKDINTYAQGEDADEYVPGEEEWDNFKKNQWDEGGQSDCGYSDSVHETLISIGKCMYGIFGEPSDTLHGKMKGIGSYIRGVGENLERMGLAFQSPFGQIEKCTFRARTYI